MRAGGRYREQRRSGITGRGANLPVGAQTPAPFSDSARSAPPFTSQPAIRSQGPGPRIRRGSVFPRDDTILICPHKRNNAWCYVGGRMGGPLAYSETLPGYLKVERLRRSIRKRRRGLRPYGPDWHPAPFPVPTPGPWIQKRDAEASRCQNHISIAAQPHRHPTFNIAGRHPVPYSAASVVASGSVSDSSTSVGCLAGAASVFVTESAFRESA